MQFSVDTKRQVMVVEDGGGAREIPLYSREAFSLLSQTWLKVGWSLKHIYTFTWLGRPLIQLPEDMLRIQEVIYRLQPDCIIETGVAHGGSLVFYASLCHALGKGRVVGVDIEIRPHNRVEIEKHPLAGYITLIEGDSTAPEILDQVMSLVSPGDRVMVVLDSDHSRQHVFNELNAYRDLVTPGAYLVATDGIVRDLADVPRGEEYLRGGSPTEAVAEFIKANPDFELKPPDWQFNESQLTDWITHWPDAWLLRK
jgi:cephalosporin hydroxylase